MPNIEQLLNRQACGCWKRRRVMGNQEPVVPGAHKNVRRLYYGFVETLGESGGNVLGTGHPADIAFNPNPNRAERNAHTLGVRKNTSPAAAHFVPTEQ